KYKCKGKRKRTAGALVEDEETARQTDGGGQTHNLGKATLARVRRRESLEGEHRRRRKRRRQSADDVVRLPRIPDHTLKVPANQSTICPPKPPLTLISIAGSGKGCPRGFVGSS